MRSITPINQLPPIPGTYAFAHLFSSRGPDLFFQVPMGTRFIYGCSRYGYTKPSLKWAGLGQSQGSLLCPSFRVLLSSRVCTQTHVYQPRYIHTSPSRYISKVCTSNLEVPVNSRQSNSQGIFASLRASLLK